MEDAEHVASRHSLQCSSKGNAEGIRPERHVENSIATLSSRPHTSNDNPFSESCFKTLKDQPRHPKRFGCIHDAKTFCRAFFDWYNQHHHHRGIGLMTPNPVHFGQANEVHAARQTILDFAFRANPNRFVNKAPAPSQKPTAVWINPPTQKLKVQA